jgi:hypothetical protein
MIEYIRNWKRVTEAPEATRPTSKEELAKTALGLFKEIVCSGPEHKPNGYWEETAVPVSDLKIADFPEGIIKGIVLVGLPDYLTKVRIAPNLYSRTTPYHHADALFGQIYDGNKDELIEIHVRDGIPDSLRDYSTMGREPLNPHVRETEGNVSVGFPILFNLGRTQPLEVTLEKPDLTLILLGVRGVSHDSRDPHRFIFAKYFAPTQAITPAEPAASSAAAQA